MSIKTIKDLKEEISLLPSQYKEALERQTQAILDVVKIEQELANLKRKLSSENETDDKELVNENDESIETIKLEQDLEKLKLKLAKTEFAVELNVRKSSEKITESYVKALIGSDEEVCHLKEQLINAKANLKVKQSELERERKERWEKERLSRSQSKPPFESEELDELNIQLAEAQAEQYSANDVVELLKIKLETYRLLVGLENLEDIE